MTVAKSVLGLSFFASLLFFLAAGAGRAAEQQDTVATIAAIAQQAGAAAQSGSLGELININTASPEMLSAIPGVGPQIGQAIAAYRQANGAFQQLQELTKIEGIDAALVEKIAPFLTL